MYALRHKSRFTSNVFIRLYNTEVPLASSTIRSRFLDYFVSEKDHTFVRSSPLKPISDPTIPFVNAGMVQFKSVLQGKNLSPAFRVANSQKCARVGGKHNDLDTVGMDGYHHTFFEMLGNWSFGSCNKHEACKMAWELLTGPYALDPKRLYVTYFGGDNQMGLKPDLETREIWRELGVDEIRILPFEAKDNFWEMGLVGPCGPCTEIHVDHIPGRHNAANRVNAGFPDLTELWNLVFIQFNRGNDGLLLPLKQSHVDTGMGFERLVAVLNGVKSNYDTDLFKPLMDVIQKISGCPPYSKTFDPTEEAFERDKAYRILCDHSRLLTVALADGVVPHHECKVRWVLRRALNIVNDVMKKDEKVLIELSNFVADSLHSIYPEIGRNLSKVQRVILDEAEIYKALKLEFPKNWTYLMKETPQVESLLEYGSNRNALASAFRKMTSNKSAEVSPSLAFHLYESHGINAELIGEIAKLSGKSFSVEAYEKEFEDQKHKTKLMTASGSNTSSLVDLLTSAEIPETYCNLMYEYDPHEDEGYTFPNVSAKVVGLLVDGKLQHDAAGGEECGVILDRTNFYHTAGGQVCDEGEIVNTSGRQGCCLYVKEVTKCGDYVVHLGNLNGSMKVGDEVVTKINETNRIACMRNHTLAHLISGELQHIFDAPLQEKCVVHPSYIKMTYYLHGEEFKAEDAKQIEDALMHTIEDELPVDRYTVNTWSIPYGTTLVPDESYPVENIHIIDIKRGNKVISREACCGTHVLNTKDIGKFCIVEVIKSKKTSVCAVTGSEADEALSNSKKLSKSTKEFFEGVLSLEEVVKKLNEDVNDTVTIPALRTYIDEIRKVFKGYNKIKNFIKENSRRFSYVTYDAVVFALDEGHSKINYMARYVSELEVRRKAHDSRYIAHVMQLSEHLQKVPLNKYTRLVDIPIMLFALHENELKVRCCIPQNLVSEDFNALSWMKEAMSYLILSDQDAEIASYKIEGQTASVQSRSVVYKSRVSSHARRERCWKASEAASKFAQSQIKTSPGKQSMN